jgi:Ca-activated chloride channel family protein
MGVGLDYNENLMIGLAESGGGNYYFIESPHNLSAMIQKELHALSCVVAQNAFIELTLGGSVRIVDVIGCEHRFESERYVIPLGDVYANERREFTVELDIPECVGSMVVAAGALFYYDGNEGVRHSATFSTRIRYTHDVSLIEKHRDWDIQAKAEVAVSTRQVERAMKALDEGRKDDAAQEISAAKQLLMLSPAATNASETAAAALGEQRSRLESYEELLDSSGNARQTKKAIQYDNYKVQKNRN